MFLNSIIIVSLSGIILSLIIYLLYLKYIKKHTRERFAFMGVTAVLALITTIIYQMYSSQGFVTAFINTSNFALSTHFSTYTSDIKDHIIAIIAVVVLMNFIFKLHQHWDGPISEIAYNKQRFNKRTTIVNEAILQFKDLFLKEKVIFPYFEEDKKRHLNIFTEQESNKLPWYENVFELLTYSSNQYKINLKEDYYPDERCFISKYGKDKNIAILCTIDYPNDTSIRDFVHFAQSFNISIYKYIIAIKNHHGELTTINKEGVEIFVRNESEMLEALIDFSSYSEFVAEQFKKKEITPGTNISLEDTYVKLKGKNDKNESIGELEDYIFHWLDNSNDNKHLAILGEYGCGKSVLSLKVAYELLFNKKNHSRIPILIELRGKSPRNLNIAEILSTWAANYRLDAASLLKLHKAGRLLIIFEGFDEMDMIGDREMRLNHFQRLWEFATPGSKIMITGRPNFFLDDKELKINLGIDKPYETSPYCEAIYLEKFGIGQIKSALRNIDSNTREQVLEILEKKSNANFYDLVSRPSILHLVAVIWKDRKLAAIKDKINSATVISEFIKYSYSRQGLKNAQFPLSESEREYFMLGIAVAMLKTTEFSNQISSNDLKTIILKLYKDFPKEITPSKNAIQNTRTPLKESMIDNNHAEETVMTDIRSCGILVNDLTRKDYFKFAHKSFLEYQVSFYFIESILQDKEQYNIIVNSITKSLDISLSSFTHSKETIAFTSEILISKLNLSKDDNPHEMSKRLFEILHKNKFLGRHPYLSAITDMHMFLILLISIPFLSLVFNHIFSLFIALEDEKTVGLNMLIFVLHITLLPVLFLLFFFILTRNYTLKRKIIWLKCCDQLNIPRGVILRLVPKRYIEFLERGGHKSPLIKNLIFLFSEGIRK